jgi:hypothetical protein
MAAAIASPVKRGRGRPRKDGEPPIPSTTTAAPSTPSKRAVGRPRKAANDAVKAIAATSPAGKKALPPRQAAVEASEASNATSPSGMKKTSTTTTRIGPSSPSKKGRGRGRPKKEDTTDAVKKQGVQSGRVTKKSVGRPRKDGKPNTSAKALGVTAPTTSKKPATNTSSTSSAFDSKELKAIQAKLQALEATVRKQKIQLDKQAAQLEKHDARITLIEEDPAYDTDVEAEHVDEDVIEESGDVNGYGNGDADMDDEFGTAVDDPAEGERVNNNGGGGMISTTLMERASNLIRSETATDIAEEILGPVNPHTETLFGSVISRFGGGGG